MALYDAPPAKVKPSGWRTKTHVELRGRSAPPQSPLTIIYSGQICIGFTILRGKMGVEAFGADGKSRGIHPSQHGATRAVTAGEAAS